ncbi:DUF480 domain-containing protein [Solimonas sp. K1W22B-7]|uniref:DUF480 domain-containing protein n=1 Tax=Solimonas sp. K1W22B-7 TaxID=2303331 RepID=UPI000E3370CA|nr:DUF480 domain-containing protein [Solimonas sp. K1W22B-7]AXQ27206.1 DUF480 domain-containing protein [Solimonas sp. K1W22B-7]
MSQLLLSPAEARVLASLVEKSITTPQYYPMTVNAIMLAGNQKTSRSPVLSLTEGDVGNALNRLEELHLVGRDSFSARAQKYRHQFSPQLLLKPQTAGILATLMLRGPQTLAELRANGASLGGPTEGEALAAALNDLADRAQPLVVLLPRAAGQKEARYAHTLCGDAGGGEWAEPEIVASRPEPGALAALEARIQALEARVLLLEDLLK